MGLDGTGWWGTEWGRVVRVGVDGTGWRGRDGDG